MADNPTPPNPARWWTNRRRLAWLSFSFAVLETLCLIGLALMSPKAIEALGAVIAWSYGLWGANIAAYIGFATWADVAATRK